jgi:2-oxoglutarate ferredoxin oxidoreductase subunit delta
MCRQYVRRYFGGRACGGAGRAAGFRRGRRAANGRRRTARIGRRLARGGADRERKPRLRAGAGAARAINYRWDDMAGVKFYIDLCKGCRLCTTACPKGIVAIDAETLNSKGFHPATVRREDMGKCIGCAFCATICPDCAIEVER